MVEQRNKKVKLAILGFSTLLMGVIGISGGLSVIGEHFKDVPQTSIQLLISLPCIVIIAVSLLIGKIQEFILKKTLIIFAIICFLVGGVAPAFASSFAIVLVFRAILGIGIGILQPLSGALVAENFCGDERSKVMGQQTAAQMLGCAAMVFVGGQLALVSWDKIFFVHLVAITPLILVLLFLPTSKPAKVAILIGEVNAKVRITYAAFGWIGSMFLYFLASQIFSTFIAFFVATYGLGSSAQSGVTVMIFALAGLVMGLFFGRLTKILKHLTLSVGFSLMGLSYVFIAFAPNMQLVYIGSILAGLSCASVMPCIVVGASESVDAFSAPMVISMTMCSLNLSMFLSPYVATFVAGKVGGELNKSAFIFGAALAILMAIVAFIGGTLKNLTGKTH